MDLENKFFKLNGDTLVAIDWSNVYGWHDDLGWEIDPDRLFEYLNSYQKIVWYFRQLKVSNSEISNKLYEITKKVENLPKISIGKRGVAYSLSNEKQLKEIYDLIDKLDKTLKKLNVNIENLQHQLIKPVKRRKCDFDVEISCDVYNNLNRMKAFMLFSGDGDYAALVRDVIKKGRQAIVVFGPNHKGKEYDSITKGLFLCSVNKLKEFIEQK